MKEVRIIEWLSRNLKPMNQEQFRFFLGIASLFIKDNDPTFFHEEELFDKCLLFKTISLSWDAGIKTYFEGYLHNASNARRQNKSKYRRKYVDLCFTKTLFSSADEYALKCLEAFAEVYVKV
jgi:hypothetical protein